MTAAVTTVQNSINADLVDAKNLALYIGYVTYAGTPSGNVTPNHIGQMLYDSANSDFYIATGAANTDWKKLTP